MPDPGDTAAGETVGNWQGAPGTTGTSTGTTTSNGTTTTTSGTTTSPTNTSTNNGATGGTTSAPGKTDSQAKTSPTSSGGTPETKSQSTNQSISSPASSSTTMAANGASQAAQTAAPTSNAAQTTTPAASSAPKVSDPSRGTMAGSPVTGATYTAGSPTPTYDATDGIVSMAEAEARWNAAQALNSAFGVGPQAPAGMSFNGVPSAPSYPSAPQGAFGPRANPGADYMGGIMAGTMGPVGPVSGLMESPPDKVIGRVAPEGPAYATSGLTAPDQRRTLGAMMPSVPGTLPSTAEAKRTAGYSYNPMAAASQPENPATRPNPTGNSSTVAQNDLGATGDIATLAQVVADPNITTNPPAQNYQASNYTGYGAPFNAATNALVRDIAMQPDAINPMPGGQSNPASGYPASEYSGYGADFNANAETQIGQWENVDEPTGSTIPSQVATQPQTIGQLGNRIGYEYNKARDGFKNIPRDIYNAIVGGDYRGEGRPGIGADPTRNNNDDPFMQPQDEQLDVETLQQLMAQLKRRGVTGNQQLKLILSTFV